MSISCMLVKYCNGNPNSDELAPRQIQSISCNVRNRKKTLKQLWALRDTLDVTSDK